MLLLLLSLQLLISPVVFASRGVQTDGLLEELSTEHRKFNCDNSHTNKFHACRCGFIDDRIAYVEGYESTDPSSDQNDPERSLQTSYPGGACVDGQVTIPGAIHSCENMDLAAYISVSQLGDDIRDLDDIWGWTHGPTGQEFAIVCGRTRYIYVNITDPTNPGILAWTESVSSSWHDVKVYNNYAFMVSEAPNHHLRIFNLELLLTLSADSPQFFPNLPAFTFADGTAHNIVINEASGFAYIVGSSMCNGGLYILDINNVSNIEEAGCFEDDGYTHDAQCVTYHGPDTEHFGEELCFVCNEDHVAVVDVSTKSSPFLLSEKAWSHITDMYYVHQGWLSEDHRYFYINDETTRAETHTLVIDFFDLDSPSDPHIYNATVIATDHNNYVKDNLLFQAQYTSGLRVVDLGMDPTQMSEIAHFDTSSLSGHRYNGAWGNYPFFQSCTVVVSDIERGLYILTPTGPVACGSAAPTGPTTPSPTHTPTVGPTSQPTRSPAVPTFGEWQPRTSDTFDGSYGNWIPCCGNDVRFRAGGQRQCSNRAVANDGGQCAQLRPEGEMHTSLISVAGFQEASIRFDYHARDLDGTQAEYFQVRIQFNEDGSWILLDTVSSFTNGACEVFENVYTFADILGGNVEGITNIQFQIEMFGEENNDQICVNNAQIQVRTTNIGTPSPTSSPSKAPSSAPTTHSPTHAPSFGQPTSSPTKTPTIMPTSSPTNDPTKNPTSSPSTGPTSSPSKIPTGAPTHPNPTEAPTNEPTKGPTSSPTASPTASPSNPSPTRSPTASPTVNPTTSPSNTPSSSPMGGVGNSVSWVDEFESWDTSNWIDADGPLVVDENGINQNVATFRTAASQFVYCDGQQGCDTNSVRLRGRTNAVLPSKQIDITSLSQVSVSLWYQIRDMDNNQNDRFELQSRFGGSSWDDDSNPLGWTVRAVWNHDSSDNGVDFNDTVNFLLPTGADAQTVMFLQFLNPSNQFNDRVYIARVEVSVT